MAASVNQYSGSTQDPRNLWNDTPPPPGVKNRQANTPISVSSSLVRGSPASPRYLTQTPPPRITDRLLAVPGDDLPNDTLPPPPDEQLFNDTTAPGETPLYRNGTDTSRAL